MNCETLKCNIVFIEWLNHKNDWRTNFFSSSTVVDALTKSIYE